MFREKCQVLGNEKTAPGHYVIRFKSSKIAQSAKPGQFVQVACLPCEASAKQGVSHLTDPLLPRPFSFLDAGKKEFSFLYQVVGKGTELLSQAKKGDGLWVLGPLGNGFNVQRTAHSAQRFLVGGGVGIPPLYHLAEYWIKNKITQNKNIHVFLGARDKSLLLLEKDFKKLGVGLNLATDNGSKGDKGFVTQTLENFLRTTQNALRTTMYTCGPTPMLKAVSALSIKYHIPCEVSVEVPMACGFGACLGCAIRVRNKDTHDAVRVAPDERFAIACCEGPVFRAESIVW